MSLILGIDTATSGCSAAVMRGGVALAHASSQMARGQSEALAPMIEAVLKDADVAPEDLGAVAVTRGPGAFTGLRIGLATARALALTIDCPCMGVTTFDVLLQQALAALGGACPPDKKIMIAVESKREELFIQVFEGAGSPVGPPAVMSQEDIGAALSSSGQVIVAGDAGGKVVHAFGEIFELERMDIVTVPDARFVASTASRFIDEPGSAPPTPLYLRPPDVTLPGKS